MCVSGCQEKMVKDLGRRGFLKAVGALGGLALVGCASVVTEEPKATDAQTNFSKVVDLTHALGPDFPTYFGPSELEIETVYSFDPDGFNVKRWLMGEHLGTHVDSPFHFSADQDSLDMIPAANLVLPLAVVNIRQKAQENDDAQLTLDDLIAWEREHGQLPERACVAMYSGWEEHVKTDKYRNADADGLMHFPGFHVEAVQFLLEERNALSIAVDTLSLDYGPSAAFEVHHAWLPTNRWGIECVANLGELPPVGATIVAGAPKIKGASGGPSRVFALV